MRFVFILVAVLAVSHAKADVLRVDPSAPNGGDGLSWGRAFNSLTDALAAATSGDELWVVRGSYVPDTPAGRDATFTVPMGVQVYGGFEGGETSRTQRDWQNNITELNGAGTLYTVVTAADSVILDGFTISKGLADGSGPPQRSRGAGVYANNARVTIQNSVFTQHQSSADGAAVQLSGTASEVSRIRDCVIAECSGSYVIDATAPVVIQDSVITNNAAGAISLRGDTIHTVIDCQIESNNGSSTILVATENSSFTEIDRCVIANNTADIGGAVRYALGGDHQLRNSFIRSNTGTVGTLASGGVADNRTIANSTLRVENNVFVGNSSGQGAAIRKQSPATLIVTGSTIVGNSSAGFGAGISTDGDGTILWNTIIYGNTSGAGSNDERVSVFAPLNSTGVTADRCIIEHLGMTTFPQINATNSSSADPMFVDADGPNNMFGDADDNVRLMPGSPAIDAGNNLFVGPFVFADIYNQTRFRDDTGTPDTGDDGGLPPIVDIGAAEFQGTTPIDCVADTNGDGLLTPADFNGWILAFNNQSPACDQNGDGACTPADFNAWIINFNAGCP